MTHATHELKTWPPNFAAVLDGSKTFEMRPSNRSYRPGDLLLLREYEVGLGYTGRMLQCEVGFILRVFSGLESGFVCMSLLNRRAVA